MIGTTGNNNSRSVDRSRRHRWPWVVVAAALVVSTATQCSSKPDPAPSTKAEETTSTPSEAPPPSPAAPVAAPTVISLPITLAEKNNGITVDATDVGQEIVDGVDTQRAIFDKGNWRIVAQCDQMVGKTLKAGVIKADEFMAISQAGQGRTISDNTFKSLLDCPA